MDDTEFYDFTDYSPEIEFAWKHYGNDDNINLSFDDKPDIAVEETGVWVACWAWVAFEDSREKAA